MAGISRLVSKESGSFLRQLVPQLARNYFDEFPNYLQMLADAKSTARRSILVDNCSFEHIDLRDSDLNNIEHVYSVKQEFRRAAPKNYTIIEFKSEQDADSVIKQAHHMEGSLPVQMRIMRYAGPNANSSLDRKNLPFPIETVQLSCKRELFPDSTSYTDLIANNMMSLVNFKTRLITLVNLEKILCAGVFEAYELVPFGSSVIDLACDSGDLDIVVTPKDEDNSDHFTNHDINDNNHLENSSFKSGLVHLDKILYGRDGSMETMLWFDRILKQYSPLTDNLGVLFVRNAKVPIIKFKSRITGIDCDLSFNIELRNSRTKSSRTPGIVMAQALYSLCRNNSLFAPVIIYLRIFAKLTNITSKEPNIGLTNFQFLSLILFYLQQVSIVPDDSQSLGIRLDINHLRLGQSRQSIYRQQISPPADPIVPPFKDLLRDDFEPKSVELSPSQLEQLLPEAIMGFLKFYSDFDFYVNSIDIYDSKLDRKDRKQDPISISNPLDQSKNICHNVNRKSLEEFKVQLKTNLVRLKDAKRNPLTLINNYLSKHQR